MSAKMNIGLTIGVFIIMLVSSSISVYYLMSAKDQVAETKMLIIEGRQIGNQRGNVTLDAVRDVLLGIRHSHDNLLGNLTEHRTVTNDTRDHIIIPILNQTNTLIKQLNQTNNEGRNQAVDEIVAAVENNTKLIQQILEK
jgi:hypothetical protein